jgi:hypothetical protein
LKNTDPIFWPGTDVDLSLKQRMQRNYDDSISNLQVQWYQADLDQRTYLGDPDVWNILYPLGTARRRKMFTFNLTHSTIQMISGHQRRNRKSTIAIPVQSPVQKTADQMTKCLYYVHSKGAYTVYSDAFEQGACVQGFGLISIFPDFSSDPVSPEIKLRYVDFKSVIIDPYFRQKDLSDCRYIWVRQYFSKEELMSYYPEHEEKISDIPTGGYSRDDKFYYMPENVGLNTQSLLAVDEYWYLSTREVVYAVDTLTEETKEINGDEEDIRVVMQELKDKIRIVKKQKQTVRRAILINGKVLIDEVSPWGLDRYPFVGVYGNFNPDTIYFDYKFKGVVRDIRDANYLFTLRKVADLDILSSQQQGLKVKKGALVTPDDSMNTGNGRVLVINEKMQMSDVEPMQIIPPSPVMLQMEEMLKSVMREISGVNEELLGSAVDDKAGVLAMLRQGSGLTTLQKLFDQMDESQKLCGDIIIEMIQNLWTYGKVKSVIGEEPTQEFDNKAFFKYGAKIIQGTLTESQQQLELAQLFELQARFGNIFPAEEIVECMTIQNKDRIVEKMMANQKAAMEQQQKMSELQMQQMQVDNDTKLAYAESQRGLASERIARIQTDMAVAEDKLQRANTADTAALLNMIKALKELEGMDISHMQQKLELLKSIQPEVSERPEALQV